MLKVLILFAIFSAISAEAIEGAVPAQTKDFPYAVSVLCPRASGYMHCSTGTILNNRWILTTGSRLKGFNSPRVYRIRTFSEYHLDYNVEDQVEYSSYDLVLLKVDKDIVFHENTTSIEVSSEESFAADLKGTLVGWGTQFVSGIRNEQFYSVELKTVGTVDGTKLHVSTIDDTVCFADVGGPFVVNGKLAGISTVNVGCGLADQYVTRFDASIFKWLEDGIALK